MNVSKIKHRRKQRNNKSLRKSPKQHDMYMETACVVIQYSLWYTAHGTFLPKVVTLALFGLFTTLLSYEKRRSSLVKENIKLHNPLSILIK